MIVGIVGLGTTGVELCYFFRKQKGTNSWRLKGLYREVLHKKEECVELGIETLPSVNVEDFVQGLDWVIVSVNKDWLSVISELLKYLSSNTSLIFISSTSVYGDRGGARVSEETSLDKGIVGESPRELISAEELVVPRHKSYVIRPGLLYRDLSELKRYIESISVGYLDTYINLTPRNVLYSCIHNTLSGNMCGIQNVVSQSLRLKDIREEIGIQTLFGSYPLRTNVNIGVIT